MSNLSFVRGVGDGTNRQFLLSNAGTNIGYFRTSDIHAYVDDVEVTFTIDAASPHIAVLDVAPKLGADVLLRREMPVTKPYADFARGNNFGHRQVNNTFVQQLYLTQEMLDGFTPAGFYLKQELDAGLHKLINVSKADTEGDAVEFKQWSDADKDKDSRLKNLEGSVVTGESLVIPYRYTAAGGETEVFTGYQFNYCDLAINGIVQTPEDSFSILGGKLLFAEPLEEGDVIFARLGSYTTISLGVTFKTFIFDAAGGETLIAVPDHATAWVYINGVHQIPSRAYAFLGSDVQLAEPLEEGDTFVMSYLEKS